VATTSEQAGGPEATRRPALRRCIGPDPERFAADVWSRAPLLSTREELRAENSAGFDDLFSLDAVDELLSRRGLRTPFIRLAKGGVVTPASRYTRPGGTGAMVGDQVADDRVLELFLDGHTVVFQGLHRLWPPLIDFAGALTTDLGHPVQVNAYVTPSQSQGFSAHYDVHDVFVLQVAGEKRWRIHEPVHEAPLRDQPWADRRTAVEEQARGEPVIDTVLRPGDALYLPRGYLHAAEALGGVTCHLTVGVHPVTRHDVLGALLDVASDDVALRASLPLGVDVGDPAAVEADVAATVAALTERLRTVTAAEVADRLAESLVGSNRPGPIAPLAQAASYAELGPDSVLRARPFQRYVVDLSHDGVVLRLGDRTLRLPAATDKAVRALAGGAVLRVADLPGLDPEDALVLARRLVRESVVVVDGR
jgi:bifunctional lysine-specific demethylase and histidyl-hydroxylase NO66